MSILSRRAFVAGLAIMPAACAGIDSVQSPRRLRPAPAATFEAQHPHYPVAFDDSPLRRMSHYGVPGMSVAISQSGRPPDVFCYGERAAGNEARVNAETVFQAGSISKAIAAVGALALVQRGAIALDDDVRPRVFMPFADGVIEQPITLRALLSHTAGVNIPSYSGFAPGEPLPSLKDILVGAPNARSPRVEVAAAPGAQRYSGGGFEIVEMLIEEASGHSFSDFMRAHVFDPLGMERTTYEPTPPARLSENIADGHGWTGAPRDTPWLIYPQRAAASLWSTPSDLCGLLSDITASYRDTRNGILTPQSARTMMSEIVPGMGLGFGVDGGAGRKIISHAGWTRGYRSYAAAFPETGDAIVVLANGDRGNEVSMEMVRGAARSLAWPGFPTKTYALFPIDGASLAAYAGSYEFAEAGFSVDMIAEDRCLVVRTPRGAAYNFYPIDTDRFVAQEDAEMAVFGADGERHFVDMWGMRAVKARSS